MPTSSDEVTLSNDSKRINNEFKETTHALEQSRWMSLPPEKIKLVYDSIVRKQAELCNRAKDIQAKLKEDLENGVTEHHEEDHEEFWDIKRRYSRLERSRVTFYDHWQRQHIRSRIAKRFSEKFERNLESTVLVLII